MCFSPIYVLWISQSQSHADTLIASSVGGLAGRISAAAVAGAAADAAVAGRGC